MKEILNRKAEFNYFLHNKFIAGIQLTGSEVKSVREGQVDLSEAYCHFKSGELFIKNMYIKEYKNAGFAQHDPIRERKLLLKKEELRKLERRLKEKSLTIVPVNLFLNEKGKVKLTISLASGKRTFDKSRYIKERDIQRAALRELADD